MNNGSPLDSLLATNTARPAHKKINRAQEAAKSNEGFQGALEKLRPKVAVMRPELRNSDKVRATPTGADKTPMKRDLPAQGSAGKAANPQKHPNAADRISTESLQTGKSHKTTGTGAVTDSREPIDDERLDSGLPFNAQQVVQKPLLAEMLGDPLAADTSESLILGEGLNEALLLDEAGLVETDLTGISLLSPELQKEAILSPALANQIATSLGISTATTGVASPVSSMMGNGQLNLAGELPLTLKGDAELGLAEGGDSGNPDLLLLNAKSIFSKLAEANASQLDTSTPAADLKALTAATPAVESLSRLSEASSPAARSFVVQTGVPVALGQPQWGQAVGERVLWLAAQNVTSAEIRLDPPELGPMQVRVSVNQDQVNVSFTSPHPAVRDVLDQQLNRLREMFAEQGLNLVDVDVSDKSFAQQHQQKDDSNKAGSSSQLEDDEAAALASSIIMSDRLVDHYA